MLSGAIPHGLVVNDFFSFFRRSQQPNA